MSRDVFISHASADAALAEILCAALEETGVSSWIAPRDVLPGAEYAQAIVEAIDDAKLVVLLLSDDACHSPHVSREIERAVSRSLPILAFRLPGAELTPSMEYYLSQSHWLEAESGDPRQQLPQLVEAARSWITGPGQPGGEAPEADTRSDSDTPADPAPGKADATPGQSAPDLPPRRGWVPAVAGGVIIAIGLAAIVFAMLRPATQSPPAQQTAGTTRIAVVPSAAAIPEERTFLVRGVSEALTNHLSRVPGVSVIAGASSFSAASSGLDLEAIAGRLEVRYLIEIGLRDDDRGSELTVRLVDARTLVTEMADSIRVPEGEADAGLNGQLLAIARKLRGQLGMGQLALTSDVASIDPRAYESFLRAMEARALVMSDNRSRGRAMRFLKQATQIDPTFTDAWGHLCWSYVGSFGSPLSRDFAAFARETEAAIATALALDPRQPMANTAAAFWYAAARLDLDRARGHLDIAMEVAPGSVYTQAAQAIYSGLTGDTEAALVAYETIVSLDPLNFGGQNMAAVYQSSVGLFEEAFEFFEWCHVDRCLSEGFVFMASGSANFTRDEALRAAWGERLQGFAAFIDGLSDAELPPSARLVGPMGVLWFDDPDDADAIATIRTIFERELIGEYLGFNGPTLARILDEDRFFSTLELALEAGQLFYGAGAMAPFYGTNPYPDWVLQHPRYHALWARPETARLATLLESRGHTAGLPKPAVTD